MPWSKYRTIIADEWRKLSRSKHGEADYQRFFERHPSMLPWYGAPYTGAHGMFPSAVISHPVLTGLSSKVPDFLWIPRSSAAVYAVLIEIESPEKAWATQSGQPSHALKQAIDQIYDWKVWFSDPLNNARFRQDYRIPQEWLNDRDFQERYVLIYGREGDPSLKRFNKKRSLYQHPRDEFMTYDRIGPWPQLSNCMCVKIDGQGYQAISVPPTLVFGPAFAFHFSVIRGKEGAIMKNPYLSQARKEFLRDRCAYWDVWAARTGGKGAMIPADEE
jgi:hypothetical protein